MKPAQDFADVSPVVKDWHRKVKERKAPSTATIYLSLGRNSTVPIPW